MDIEKLILKKIQENGQLTSSQLTKATGFSRVYVNRFLKQLVGENRIVLVGKANKAKYVRAGNKKAEPLTVAKILQNKGLQEDTVLDQIKQESAIFDGLPKNIKTILDYAFTEILNNAIEHSKSKNIKIKIFKASKTANFMIRDFGVGVFKNVEKKFGLKTEVEGINHLLKGKQTTSPAGHSGEGIFFTSKAADLFILESFGKKLVIDNLSGNIFIKNIKPLKGTRVSFKKSLKSKSSLSKIFNEYAGDNFEFSKTKVLIKLGAIDNVFLSRSQARRIIFGLDKFKEIILDFKGVDSVGQSFADEIFRVWQNNHPHIIISFQNANDNSLLMIKRAKPFKNPAA
jgi:anti-sigma regulatory factor (Ser/Thr protein kinase)